MTQREIQIALDGPAASGKSTVARLVAQKLGGCYINGRDALTHPGSVGKVKPGFEGGQMKFIRRIPKLGFKNFTRPRTLAVNLGDLECFDTGSDVTLELLRKSGLTNGQFDRIKILAAGSLSKKLTVKAHAFSAAAKAKIESLGGKCEVLPV